MMRRCRSLSGLILAALAGAAPLAGQAENDRPMPPNRSAFNLYGEGDLARTSMRIQGEWMAYNINSGPGDDWGGAGYSYWGVLGTQNRPDGPTFQFFGMGQPYAGAPRGEWLRHVDEVPTLANALPKGQNQGWTSIINLTSFGEPRQFLPADGQFGTAFSGAKSTTDGTCLDHSQTRGGYQLPAGWTLLAGSNCPATWPLVGGVPTFNGAHPIPAESWEALFDAPDLAGMPSDSFDFSWWRVPGELQNQGRFFGDFATYGTYNDFNSTTLAKFGSVVPGQSADPIISGWPLGLEFSYDAFTYALPTLQNVYFWRATVVNKSEQVYGVPLDYDSLYLGFAHETGRFQEGAVYFDPLRNTIWSAESGTSGTADCNGAATPFYSCTTNGFFAGATATVILKSPLGDMRNKLFSDPTSPFFDPLSPFRGDTITFNHGRLCDYGDCFTYFSGLDNARKQFALYSSTAENLLYDLRPEEIPDRRLYSTFRNPMWPDQKFPFAHTVPGHSSHGAAGALVGSNPAPEWRYTRRPLSAPEGPDTLFFDNCGPRGCSDVWSDTMAAPGHFINQEANNGMFGMGPFRLAANDTVGLLMAIIGAPDSAALESYVANAIDFYMKFYLGPEAAPPVAVVGAQVEGVNAVGPDAAVVNLYLNDVLEEHVDPFLSDFANKLAAASEGTREFRLRQLNPDLVERIRARAEDNIERILLFKSCDGGRTFTSDADCLPDPARDLAGRNIGPGWQAYAELTPTEDGFPNVFTDANVVAGRSYLYVFTPETRGGTFAIADSVDTDGDGAFDLIGPTELNIAPKILSPLSTSTSEPNVISVYVPVSQAAGASLASFEVTSQGTAATRPLTVSRAGTVTGGQFQALFANRFTVVTRTAGDSILSTRVIVEDVVDALDGEAEIDGVVLEADTFFTVSPSGVAVSGAATSTTSTTAGQVTTTTRLYDGLGFVLLNAAGEPRLVSTVLDPTRTTPGGFFNLPDFPGFTLAADGSNPGGFIRDFWTDPDGEEILGNIEPFVDWDERITSVVADPDQLGEYALTWTAEAFGPGAPFRLNRIDPELTDQAFDESLEARAVGTTTLTDAATVELLNEQLGLDLTAEDLAAVELPFTVRNETFERSVEVAMLRRVDDTYLLGSGRDTVRVTVPDDQWVPGDRLFFIETITRDSTVGDRVVLGTDGRPIQVTGRVVTLEDVTLSCGSNACNPVVGPGSTTFLDVTPGQELHAIYHNPFDLGSAYAITATSTVTGDDVIAGGSISGLDEVGVVPNPYIFFSRYETSAQERRLMFTNLPPRGSMRIYTAIGEFVQEVVWTEQDLAGNGDLNFNLRTHEGNEFASGLYVFVVKATDPATGAVRSKSGKFVVIR